MNGVEDHNFGGGKGTGTGTWDKGAWQGTVSYKEDLDCSTIEYQKKDESNGSIETVNNKVGGCKDAKCERNHKQEVLNVSGQWEKITLAADSGAVDHVIMKSEALQIPLTETEASKAGMCYTAANGTDIANYGEKKISGTIGNQQE